ncbi:PhnD/SsuA/transferrin family substrate-binding protein [Sutterella wadsworthensis]|uniref:PhnD/SsuA/transferrin family substrate-binding protein n=1 Tax=Sutterella wadsworthensis TaxID=40545 RepID=UPI0026E08A88|nr:PhnD/SsuA/transferrin family substrate-binding protein [Sutterella wadsworthensis]
MISSGISSSLLKLVGIVVFFLVFKGVSLTNAAELRIGVTYLSAPNPSLSIIQKTTDYLNTHLVDGVRLQFYEIRELEEAIRKHEVDLVLSGAGFYRRLHDHGLRILATLVTDRGPDPDHSNGSAMIVLASRSDLKTLEDLRGKTLAATVANGFQGYQIGILKVVQNRHDTQVKMTF